MIYYKYNSRVSTDANVSDNVSTASSEIVIRLRVNRMMTAELAVKTLLSETLA